MLFNSYVFLFGFLPLALAGCFLLLAGGRERPAFAFLAIMSLAFYGFWDVRFVPLLLASILFNYHVGRALTRHAQQRPGDRRLLVLGIGANLALLAYFKYAGFLVASVNHWLGSALPFPEVLLPLGISFFTFTQIAYLVDAYRKEVRDIDFVRYTLFVTFFPHLIAGPVLHHAEVMPQFRSPPHGRWPLFFALGATLFLVGLAKKTVLADSFAEFATPVFAAAERGAALSPRAAWGGALAYTLQLYFDFSAYSDMAIGLALLFGVRFPANFNSPYQAESLIEFWRRWHMTLSRFLRDYLYIPLGGARSGRLRRYRNLWLTMLLGGLWHGAGWTFIAWGALHGFMLGINHLWRECPCKVLSRFALPRWLSRLLARTLTFFAVLLAWVYFRADTLSGAHHLLAAMSGLGEKPAEEAFFTGASQTRWLLAGLLIVHCLPNPLQWLHRYRPALETYPGEIADPRPSWLTWRPTLRWALLTVLIGMAGLLNLNRVSEFLYFQF